MKRYYAKCSSESSGPNKHFRDLMCAHQVSGMWRWGAFPDPDKTLRNCPAAPFRIAIFLYTRQAWKIETLGFSDSVRKRRNYFFKNSYALEKTRSRSGGGGGYSNTFLSYHGYDTNIYSFFRTTSAWGKSGVYLLLCWDLETLRLLSVSYAPFPQSRSIHETVTMDIASALP